MKRTATEDAGTKPRRGVTHRLGARLETSPVGQWVVQRRAEAAERTFSWHWSNLMGTAAIGCVVVLFVTGVPLLLFYSPSSALVRYDGVWEPLQGQTVSRAYASVVDLSLEVRGGLLLRQVHHWAALLLPALLIVQVVVTYITGRHRRPRRGAWLVLCCALGAAMLGGWSGYALPDDMLAGTGLRIFHGTLVAIPLVGPQIADAMFGGGFPGSGIETLYAVHVAIAPAILLGAVILRAVLAWRLPGCRRTGDVPWVRDVSLPAVLPRVVGLLALTAGTTVLAGSLVTVAPVWEYGPADPGAATSGSQPDWYMGFLDGALRLVPPGWELTVAGVTISFAVLVPLAVIGAFAAIVVVLPPLEDRMRRDRAIHMRFERPRDTPWRTSAAVAVVAFYLMLWGAASADIIATQLHLAIEQVIVAFRIGTLAAPALGYIVAYRVCLDLRAKDSERLLRGVETGRVVRVAGGGFMEIHEPLDDEERAVLVSALGHRASGAAAPDGSHGELSTRAMREGM